MMSSLQVILYFATCHVLRACLLSFSVTNIFVTFNHFLCASYKGCSYKVCNNVSVPCLCMLHYVYYVYEVVTGEFVDIAICGHSIFGHWLTHSLYNSQIRYFRGNTHSHITEKLEQIIVLNYL